MPRRSGSLWPVSSAGVPMPPPSLAWEGRRVPMSVPAPPSPAFMEPDPLREVGGLCLVKDVAAFFGVSPGWVKSMVGRGEFRTAIPKGGRRVMVVASSVRRFCSVHRVRCS